MNVQYRRTPWAVQPGRRLRYVVAPRPVGASRGVSTRIPWVLAQPGGTALAPGRAIVLRITWVGSLGDGPVARVEGEIVGDHIAELTRVAGLARTEHGRVTLDLAHVTFIDKAGAAALRSLQDEGVDLVGGPIFLSGLIDGRPDGTGAGGVR